MKNNEDGFSTPLCLVMIFSLSLAVLSVSLLSGATERKIHSYKNDVNSRKEASAVIEEILKDFQSIKDSPFDNEQSSELENLMQKYACFNLQIHDVSTGMNRNFIEGSIYKKGEFKKFSNNAYDDDFSEYGWINPKYYSKEILKSVSEDFGDKNTFPIINEFPVQNVHVMSSEFLKASLKHFGIKDSEQKSRMIEEKRLYGFTKEEISQILEVSDSSEIFSFMGTKTAFWKISFTTESCSATFVLGAVPSKEKKDEISEYRLIEKNIMKKGGSE